MSGNVAVQEWSRVEDGDGWECGDGCACVTTVHLPPHPMRLFSSPQRASLLALAREHEITIRELDIAGEGGEGRGADAGADGSLPETSVSPGAPAPLSVDEAFDKQNAGRVAAAVAAGKGKGGGGGEGATAVALRVRGELEGRVHGSKGGE